jgi:hypothetical protein
VPVVLSTDAGGVMVNTLQGEFAAARTIIQRFRQGQETIVVNGRRTPFGELSPREQRRFDVQRMIDAARQYRRTIDAGRFQYPDVGYMPPQYDVDDEYGICLPEGIPEPEQSTELPYDLLEGGF